MECQVKDVTIHYEEVGFGRPLFALHGWPLDHRHMLNDLEPIFTERKGWRRIYLDFPGMGQTKATDSISTQDDVLNIILGFIDAVAPSESFVVAGTSYGGYIARGVLHHRLSQVVGLMLNVPVVETDPQRRKLPIHRVIHKDADFLAALHPDEQDLSELVVTQNIELLQDFRNFYSPAGVIADHEFLNRLDTHYSFSFGVDSLAQPFPAPTLITTGRFDHWCGYKEAYKLLDNYPRATFAVLDGAGHVLAAEQKTLFRALVSEWLDHVEEYARSENSPQI
jgi:pimeloyl-ACP methyl ester carboxylesterase